jgi:predicted aldo/keto reductase-like oxidoreductase
MELLKGGKLAQKLPSEMTSVFDTSAIKRSPAELALRFVWNDAGVSSLLSGMNSLEQVVENIRVANDGIQNSLGKDELPIFDKLRNAMGVRIKADCKECEEVCPQELPISSLMKEAVSLFRE